MTTHKSEVMAGTAEENGWKTQIQTDMEAFERSGNVNDIVWTLYLLREHSDGRKETMTVSWNGDLQAESLYKYGQYSLSPARKAPVLALITGQPDKSKYEKREEKVSAVTYEDLRQELPFNDESPAFDILVGVIGKSVTWITRSGSERTESVPKESNLRKSYFRVKTTSTGKRVLEWANSYGFQACYVSDIVSVA